MKIVILHGQSHHGITYHMTKEMVGALHGNEKEIKEFFLPVDGPDFCCGCNQCFYQGEQHCPQAHKVQPIAQAFEWADLIILDSPNYVMEMSGALKNFLDHMAYRWFTHRPHGSMFTKIGICICSSAGAPPSGTTKSMAKQLKWMGVSKVYRIGLIAGALSVDEVTPAKWQKLQSKTKKIAHAIEKRLHHPHPSLRTRACFKMFSRQHNNIETSWNPHDTSWWIEQGWNTNKRPWK